MKQNFLGSDVTLAEAAALARTSLRDVRNEVDRGVIDARRGPGARRLPAAAVLYLLITRAVPLLMPPAERTDLFRLLTRRGSTRGWTHTGDELRRGAIAIRIAPARRDFDARMRLLARAKARVKTDKRILGGEPVFAGTRLSVRHIGLRALAGESDTAIRADHPALTKEDIEMAALLARIGPGPGRPRKFRFRRAAR